MAGLPAAPSEHDIWKDKGEQSKLLRDDFVKMLDLNTPEGKFVDPKQDSVCLCSRAQGNPGIQESRDAEFQGPGIQGNN